MNVNSKLRATLTITCEHEGEAIDYSRGNLIDTIKVSVAEALTEESEIENLEPEVSVYVSKYAYTDNVETLVDTAKRMIEELGAEDVTNIIEILRSER